MCEAIMLGSTRRKPSGKLAGMALVPQSPKSKRPPTMWAGACSARGGWSPTGTAARLRRLRAIDTRSRAPRCHCSDAGGLWWWGTSNSGSCRRRGAHGGAAGDLDARHNRSAPWARAFLHRRWHRNNRSAIQSMPCPSAGNTSSASANSERRHSPNREPNSTWVPFSASETKRTAGTHPGPGGCADGRRLARCVAYPARRACCRPNSPGAIGVPSAPRFRHAG